jgi:hypothetical protein
MTRSKFGNRRIEYDGYIFDSLMEKRRYQELQLLVQMGDISGLRVHPRYKLQEKYRQPETGKRERAIYYEADFEYIEDGQVVTEDVKGHQTAVFKLKRKLFEQKFNRRLRLVQA